MSDPLVQVIMQSGKSGIGSGGLWGKGFSPAIKPAAVYSGAMDRFYLLCYR